jgi:hypothetical protein
MGILLLVQAGRGKKFEKELSGAKRRCGGSCGHLHGKFQDGCVLRCVSGACFEAAGMEQWEPGQHEPEGMQAYRGCVQGQFRSCSRRAGPNFPICS